MRGAGIAEPVGKDAECLDATDGVFDPDAKAGQSVIVFFFVFVERGLFRGFIRNIERGMVKRGVWKQIFDTLAQQSKHSLHMIDSTIVRAHRASSGAKGGNWANVLAAHAAAARRSSMPWSTDWEDRSASS